MINNIKKFISRKYLILISSIGIIATISYSLTFSTRNLYTNKARNITVYNFAVLNYPQRQANAFILTSSCNNNRYNATVKNLEHSFPQFFRFYCCQSLPLNDSHVHPTNDILLKKFSSSLILTIQIWTYEIPKYASNEFEWSFFFEDDVNVINPSTSSPIISNWLNYTPSLQELMHDQQVQEEHGFFYLGICGPKFNLTDRPLRSSISIVSDSIFHYKGYGFCGHAMAFTTKRARLFWIEISTYRPASYDAGADRYIQDYCARSGLRFYTFGANKHWSPQTGHHGLVFQDRGVFPTAIL